MQVGVPESMRVCVCGSEIVIWLAAICSVMQMQVESWGKRRQHEGDSEKWQTDLAKLGASFQFAF